MSEQLIVPMLSYEDGCRAMDWLVATFGFAEQTRWTDEAGRLTHGELTLGDQVIMLASPEDYRSPNTQQALGPNMAPWLNHPWIYNGLLLRVDSLDDALSKAKAHGAVLLSPVEDGFPGRRARVADLEGQRWFLIERLVY